MRNRVVAALALVCVLGLCAPQAWATVYTTTYANPADMPVFGTMIDPSGYYNSDHGVGAVAKPYGNALDRERVWILDPASTFQMLKWDMLSPTNVVRVYPDVEHNGGFNWDYLQWSLWGSNTGAENANAWTLLWDPITSSGGGVNDFVVTSSAGITTPTFVYRYGSPLGLDAWDDAFTMDFRLSDSYRYIGVRASTLALRAGYNDPEIDAVATAIPEPCTLIVWSLLGASGVGIGWWRRRRQAA